MVRRFALLLCLALLLVLAAGCTPKVEVSYDQSNQVMLEKTVDAVDIQTALKDKVPAGSKVALVSIESAVTTDHPVVALIEDGLIVNILQAGYTPVERDHHLLNRLFHEQASGKFGIPALPDSIVIEDPQILPRLATDVSSTDFMISYRILEAGIVYKKGDAMGQTKREGRVRLNARITQVPGGEVVWAGDLDGLYTDEVPSKDLPHIENYHYSFFKHGMPLQAPPLQPSRFLFFATQKSSTAAVSVSRDFRAGGER